jgi:signal transduction histidine kinase
VSLQLELTDSLITKNMRQAASSPRTELTRALMQQGREVLRDLRAKTRDAADIARVLSSTIEECQQQGGPASSVIAEGAPRTLNPLVAEDFMQLAATLLPAFQHAAATKIEVCLIYRASELCREHKPYVTIVGPETSGYEWLRAD